jgi:hypothetical protein
MAKGASKGTDNKKGGKGNAKTEDSGDNVKVCARLSAEGGTEFKWLSIYSASRVVKVD